MIPKFRAWYKNEMAEVRELDWNNEVVDLFNPHIEIPLDEIELMQSTGLLDKNGKRGLWEKIFRNWNKERTC
nr:MAG TPA: YopX protein [Caudoviricetes sp.]